MAIVMVAMIVTTNPPAWAQPERIQITARASDIDPRVRAYPEIGFLIDDEKGRPADFQQASFNPGVTPRGELVIWLMAPSDPLFDRLTGYGLHAMRIHYANKWFGVCCQEQPVGPECRGNLRLEAATGEDYSDEVDLALPDGLAERTRMMLRWLRENEHPGDWGQFLDADDQVIWGKVILAGSSHGSTTAARFAKHQRVARVVCLCGPRDQYQTWQSLPSATPANRFFAFSHVLDDGWRENHYCRSWQMLGLHEFGPIVNVDQASPPYSNTRRLTTNFDVGGNANKAHSAVTPGKNSAKNRDGSLAHDRVWEYLFTHPTDQTGDRSLIDPDCRVRPQPVKNRNR